MSGHLVVRDAKQVTLVKEQMNKALSEMIWDHLLRKYDSNWKVRGCMKRKPTS